MSCENKTFAARRGAQGEERVAAYLRSKGFIIVRRNYRDRFGEIDIIAESKSYLIFVEVKTRKKGALVSGFEAVDRAKQRRVRNTGIMFAKRLFCNLPLRFDVAQVTVETMADGSEKWHLEYLKNAF